LERSVRHFRTTKAVILVLAICVTVGALWTSTEVADGRAKLARFDAVQKQLDSIETDIGNIEAAKLAQARTQPAPQPSPVSFSAMSAPVKPFVDYCLQGGSSTIGDKTVIQYIDYQQESICSRRAKTYSNLENAETEINTWLSGWNGSDLVFITHAVSTSRCGFLSWFGHECPTQASQSADSYAQATDKLAVISNIWLPMAYGFVGTIVAALRTIYLKISASTLAPWDAELIWPRVFLGVIAGGCVGLFFSSGTTSVEGAASIGPLSLSAIAFLAGYAVEGLFSMLDQLVQRVFRLNAETPSAPSSGR